MRGMWAWSLVRELVVQQVKNLPAMQEAYKNTGSIPGSGRPPGGRNGNLLQYSCLENPMDRGAWWATVHGFLKNRPWLSSCHTCGELRSHRPWSNSALRTITTKKDHAITRESVHCNEWSHMMQGGSHRLQLRPNTAKYIHIKSYKNKKS